MGRGGPGQETHLVSWKVVCTDKRKGMLGVESLAILNRALIGKWTWRFSNDPDGIWRRLICTKYGEESYG